MQNHNAVKSINDKDFEIGFFERLGPQQLFLQTLFVMGVPYGAPYGTSSARGSFWFNFLWFWGILLSFIGIGSYFFDKNQHGFIPFIFTSIGFAKMALACYIESRNIKRKINNKYFNYLSTLDKNLLSDATSSPLLDKSSRELIEMFLLKSKIQQD